ncbi:hypothetical protein AVEN_263804-1 [Araneus ventricosus]|uniref:Uncharacterized protein n=1 Tax=Araneus ventricosus TaxID=182803 RepID=A0A4Y2TIM7_ARAVE|nr:hypothetical protein AVEN_52089-1 [Araneus ventricosus]GBO00092.1 hypothetical protein AVEN_263804-1 [Araneus ventricosus]
MPVQLIGNLHGSEFWGILRRKEKYVYNCTHPRKSLCSVSNGHISRGSGQLNGSKDKCEVNHVFLREHGMHFPSLIPLQLTGYPSGSDLGTI